MTSKWPIIELGKVISFQNGNAFKSKDYVENGHYLIRIGNVQDGKILKNDDTYVNLKDTEHRFELNLGDFLMSLTGNVGRIAQVTENILPAALNQRVARLIPNLDLLSSEFTGYLLMSPLIQEHIQKTSRGTAQQNLSTKDLEKLPIPLPPLDEQKRIVAKLDEAFADLDRLVLIENEGFSKSQLLATSLLSRVFATEESESMSFELKRFGDLVTLIRGPFGGSITKNMFVEKGYAVYEQKHAIRNQFSDFRYFITKDKYEELSRFAVSPGDLIMSCAGTIGEVAQVPNGSPPGVINQALMLIKPSANIYSGYIKKYLRSATFQKVLQDGAKGSALKNAASVSTLKQITIPLPSLLDQERIVKTLDDTEALFAVEQEHRVARMNELDRLRAAVLKSAFAGDF